MSAQTQTEQTTGYRTPRLWCVRILNDDFTPMDFVSSLLAEVFNKSANDAESITLQVHETGAGTVGVYTKDIAISKTTRATRMCEDAGHPLSVVADPIE